MIPVALQPEPSSFDAKVRQPGLHWLAQQGIPLDQSPPDPAKLPTYWRRALRDLWLAYEGVCAYLCIFFEWPLGAQSTDHFIPKSRNAGLAYEWANYRLSCLGTNRMKSFFEDLLDPFEIRPDTFVLNLASGKIKPNESLATDIKSKAQETIKRLRLDDAETSQMRADHYGQYCGGDISVGYLAAHSPFVWYEARRQGLL